MDRYPTTHPDNPPTATCLVTGSLVRSFTNLCTHVMLDLAVPRTSSTSNSSSSKVYFFFLAPELPIIFSTTTVKTAVLSGFVMITTLIGILEYAQCKNKH